MDKNEEPKTASMDEANRRELMLIIKDAFAAWDNWKAYHSDIANAHQGSPMGIVNNANLHLFRQYRNKVSNDPEVMLAEAGFTNPAEQTKPPVIKLAGMHRESIREPNPATGHTPGPWKTEALSYGESAAKIRNANRHLIVGPRGFHEKNLEANARLIAAAPELLAALKEARDLLASLPADLKELETMGAEDTACKMLEAIAKAEGGAS